MTTIKDFGRMSDLKMLFGDADADEFFDTSTADDFRAVWLDEFYCVVVVPLAMMERSTLTEYDGMWRTGILFILMKRDGASLEKVDQTFWHWPQIDEGDTEDYGIYIEMLFSAIRWDPTSLLVTFGGGGYGTPLLPGVATDEGWDVAVLLLVARSGDSISVRDVRGFDLGQYVNSFEVCVLNETYFVTAEAAQSGPTWSNVWSNQVRLFKRVGDKAIQVDAATDVSAHSDGYTQYVYGIGKVADNKVAVLRGFQEVGVTPALFQVDLVAGTIARLMEQPPISYPVYNDDSVLAPHTDTTATEHYWWYHDLGDNRLLSVWPYYTGEWSVGPFGDDGHQMGHYLLKACVWSLRDGYLVQGEVVDLLSYKELGRGMSVIWLGGQISGTGGDIHIVMRRNDETNPFITYYRPNDSRLWADEQDVAYYMELDTSGAVPTVVSRHTWDNVDELNAYVNYVGSVSDYGRGGIVLEQRYITDEIGNRAILRYGTMIGAAPNLAAEIVDARSRFT